MLINNWYVAATANEIRDEPHRTHMLGLDFVLFRDENGTIHCLSDVCCHRGGALHRGEIVSGCIACLYHGWEFNGDGQCVKIPALGDDTTIPKRARIDSYPVEERLGLVWVFIGDQAEAERPDIPDWFASYLDNPDWRVVRYTYEWTDCNWERLCENSIDTAHPSFVHKRFGNRISPEWTKVDIVLTEYGAKSTRERAAPAASQKRGAIADIIPKDRKITRVTLEWTMIALVEMLYQEMTTDITQVLYSARTPVDDHSVRSYGFQARNFLMEAQYDAERVEGLYEAIKEDHDIVRFLKPHFTASSKSREMLIESDSMELAFRNKVAERQNLGRYIDGETLARDSQHDVYVAPSPVRNADPKGWVHQTVPVRPGKQTVAEAAE